jgi:hypothetical protein
MRRLNVRSVDFIKMDVDGHEYGVLAGGKDTLTAHKPPILMELAPYLLQHESRDLEGILELLEGCGYSMSDVATNERLPFDPVRLRDLIPVGQSRNVLLQAPPAAKDSGPNQSPRRVSPIPARKPNP